MKKLLCISVALLLVMVMLVGCSASSSQTSPAQSTANSPASSVSPAASTPAASAAASSASLPAGWVNAYNGKTGQEPQPTKKDKKIVIGYTPSAMNTHHQIVIYGAQEQIKNLGLQDKVELLVQAPTGQSAVAEQVSIVEAWIEQGVDVLAVAPCAGSDEALLAAYEKAAKKGIPVFEFNTPSAGSVSPYLVSNVGYEQTVASGMMAQWVADQAKGADINVAIVEGMPGIHESERLKGFMDVANKNPNIKIVAKDSAADWSVENAMKVAENMLTAHPEIQVIWAQYDEMALGVYTVVKSHNLQDKIKVIGYENIPGAYDSIKKNEMWATIDNGPKQMGRNLITAITDYVLNGKAVDKIINLKSVVYDRNNINTFDTKEYYETK